MNVSRGERVLISLMSAVLVIVAVWGGYNYWMNMRYRNILEVSYRRAVQEAALNLSNISTDLVKGMYTGTPEQLSQVSAKLWKEASSAKSAISVLPVAEIHLDKTNEFLSQVGDYSMYLSRKALSGEKLTAEEQENFRKLREYADRLSEAVDELDDELEREEISFDEIQSLVAQGVDTDDLDDNLPALVTNSSLDAMEGGFSGYPSLIYDGPFSDHILDKTPEISKNGSEITESEARSIAEKASGQALPNMREESSALPCYVFYDDNCSVAVSKHGGKLCYLIRPKGIEAEERISEKDAISVAKAFLKEQGVDSMKESYYDEDDGIITINFAYQEGEVICYTDLIKIAVSMDNGSIVTYDARGYLVNHKERELPAPSVTVEEAAKSLSTQLQLLKSRLSLIPTVGENEVLCWELDCEGNSGDHVLVYVNAQSGAEEQILLLIEDDDGTLTK